MEEKKLIASMIQTPDGTILRSLHRHDYVLYHDIVSDEDYFIDGGTDYQRMSINKVPAKDLSVYDDAPFEEIRKYLLRGTFTDDGEFSKRIYVPLYKLSDDHIESIIVYNNVLFGSDGLDMQNKVNKYYLMEQEYRKEHNIIVAEHDYTDDDIVINITM